MIWQPRTPSFDIPTHKVGMSFSLINEGARAQCYTTEKDLQMIHKSWKFITLLIYRIILFILLVSVTACVYKEQPTAKDSIAPSPASQQSSAFPTLAPANDDVTLTFAGPSGKREFYEPLMAEFHRQYPNITVQFVEARSTTLIERAAAADVILLWDVRESRLATGYFLDLSPFMDADPAFTPDDFWPNALTACQDSEGRLLGIPLLLNVTGIFFDKAAFDAAGLPYPTPGWTWDDFQRVTTDLAHKDSDVMGYALAEFDPHVMLLAPWLDASLIASSGEVDVDGLVGLTQSYLDLTAAQAIYPAQANADWQTWQNLFMPGSSPAMWVGSLGDSMPGQNPSTVNGDVWAGAALQHAGFAPFPVSDGVENTSPILTQCAAISVGTKHPRSAWLWLDFLSRQQLTDRNTSWGLTQIPVRRSVVEAVSFWETLPNAVEPAVQFALEHAWYGTLYPQAFQAIQNSLLKTATGQGDFVTLLTAAKENLDADVKPGGKATAVTVATPRATLSPDSTVVKFFFIPNGGERWILEPLVEAFNQSHPEITVQLALPMDMVGGDGTFLETIAGQFDCFLYEASANLETEEVFDLDALVQAEEPAFEQDFYPVLLNLLRDNGKLYGLPLVSQPRLIAYNADLLARRGVQLPSSDWTFDDFLKLADEISSGQDSEQQYGYIAPLHSSENSVQWLLKARGVQWLDETLLPPVASFDSAELASALVWLKDLHQTGALLIETDSNSQLTQLAVTSGQVAFWSVWGGSTDNGYFYENQPSFQIRLIPLPIIAAPGVDSSPISVRAAFISKHTQVPQACWEWMKFLSQQTQALTGIPARQSVAESDAWIAQVGDDAAQVYRTALLRTDFSTLGGQSGNVTVKMLIEEPLFIWFDQTVESVLDGEDSEKLLATAQKKADIYHDCLLATDAINLQDIELQNQVVSCIEEADPDLDWRW
jgi:multiple sugar transport system substrate-binding protein